jgi:hypothetical protein
MQVPHAQPLHGASATGPSTVLLDTTLPAGSHTYIVSGVRCSFTLLFTASTP